MAPKACMSLLPMPRVRDSRHSTNPEGWQANPGRAFCTTCPRTSRNPVCIWHWPNRCTTSCKMTGASFPCNRGRREEMEDRKLRSNSAKSVKLDSHRLLDSERNHSAYDYLGGEEMEGNKSSSVPSLVKRGGSSNSSDEDLQLVDSLQSQPLVY
jgi:hypothetical protein